MTAASVIHPSTALRRVCPSGTGRGAAIASRPVFAARSEPADADCCSAGIGAVICWRLPPVRSSRWVRCASHSRQRCFCRAQPSQGPAWRIRIVCTDLSARRDTASGGRLLMGANLGLPTGLALEIPRRVSDSFFGNPPPVSARPRVAAGAASSLLPIAAARDRRHPHLKSDLGPISSWTTAKLSSEKLHEMQPRIRTGKGPPRLRACGRLHRAPRRAFALSASVAHRPRSGGHS